MRYSTDGNEIYHTEIALYKITTPILEEKPEVSKVIRKYNARIVEVNAVFAIVEKNGMGEEITNFLPTEWCALDLCTSVCSSSGRVGYHHEFALPACERIHLPTVENEYRLKEKKEQNNE